MFGPERRFRAARLWSNEEIRRLAPLFDGDVVNVSGWDDRDKAGSTYQTYFTAAKSYSITNYQGESGFQGAPGEIPLDLESPLDQTLEGRFDLAFNHTTLEHVFDVFTAFENICRMTRDAVMFVVPFAQVEHYTSSFGDYWRFTPQAAKRLCEKNGLAVVYQAVNTDPGGAIYVLTVGSKQPERWRGRLPETRIPSHSGEWIGAPGPVERVIGGARNGLRRLVKGEAPAEPELPG